MKNITDLRDQMTDVFESVKRGDMEPRVAKELTFAAGKIISACKVQLDYQSLKTGSANIKFLDVE